MLRYKKSANQGGNKPCVEWVNLDINQTVLVGDLIQIDATSRLGKVGAISSTTLIGVADAAYTTGGTVTAADKIPVVILADAVFRIDFYPTGTKTSFADTDKYSTSFNLKTKNQLDPDNTTSGMMKVLAYDNTGKTVDVVFLAANLAY